MFVRSANERIIDTHEKEDPPVSAPKQKLRIVIAGPEEFSIPEMVSIREGLEDRGARVDTFRMTDEFRMREYEDVLPSCTWLLLGLNATPGRELELLRVAERQLVSKVGIICLAKAMLIPDRPHAIGGRVDLIVKRSPHDRVFDSFTRTSHTLLAEDLTLPSTARDIAKAIIPPLLV